MPFESFEHEGVTVESSTATQDELRAAFGLEPVPAEEPEPKVPDAGEEPEPEPDKPAEEPEPEPEQIRARNAQGQFQKKQSPARNPEKRIDQVIARQRTAEEERDLARKENDSLKQRLSALEAQRREPQAPPQPQASTEKAFPGFEEWSEGRVAENKDARYETYIRELARDEWQRSDRQKEEAQAQRQIRAAHDERMALARKQIPDYNKRINPSLQVPDPLRDAILESVAGPVMLVYFSDHPEQIQEFANLSARRFEREIGRLESWLMAGTSGNGRPASASTVPAVSAAKPPGKPVGSSAPTSDPNEITDELPFEEYFKRANAADRKAGRLR